MTNEIEFVAFPKIARLTREMFVTEKIDGTNAQIIVGEDGSVYAASRKRIITPEDDNFGFARWVNDNADTLRELGPGRHFGEWWGSGIQRRYNLTEKRFSLFNVQRWGESRPSCCSVIPLLYRGPFDTGEIDRQLEILRESGSAASPGFMRPEGVIAYHTASGLMFKKTLEKDAEHKGMQREVKP
jgi:hypothetical protein